MYYLSPYSTAASSKCFLTVVVMGGLAAFGPDAILKMNLLHGETSASLTFGGIVSLAGLIGTPMGGKLFDRWCQGKSMNEQMTLALKMVSHSN